MENKGGGGGRGEAAKYSLNDNRGILKALSVSSATPFQRQERILSLSLNLQEIYGEDNTMRADLFADLFIWVGEVAGEIGAVLLGWRERFF